MQAIIQQFEQGGVSWNACPSSAKEILSKHYLQVFSSLIQKWARGYEDCACAGHLGLVRALARFSPNGGATFKTYANRCIYGEIQDECRRFGRLSRYMHKLVRHAGEVEQKFFSVHGRKPKVEEAAEIMGIGRKKTEEALVLAEMHTVGICESIPDSREWSDPVASLEHKESMARLRMAYGMLTRRERQVFLLIMSGEGSGTVIAAKLGIGESRVSQIRSRMLLKLRRAVQDDS